MVRILKASLVAATIAIAAAPAQAFDLREALQAVENLGQWSVMADHCGSTDSASNIRQSIMIAIEDSSIDSHKRQKLASELQYWVKTINRDFRNGGLHVVTACPIWETNGHQEVKKELAILHRQLS